MIFVAFMVCTVMLVSYLVYSKWLSTISNSSSIIAQEENRDLYNQLDTIISKHTFMNEVNQRLIANHVIDFSEVDERNRLLQGVMQTYQGNITRFSYATETGEYYTIDDEYVVGELDHDIESDPRSSLWYKSAKEQGKPVYSTVNKSISVSWPIYDKAGNIHGVTNTELLLTDINEFLSGAVKQKSNYALIVDKNTGVVVANSSNLQDIELIDDDSEVDFQFLVDAYQRYYTKNETNFKQDSSKGDYFIDFKEFSLEGINWVIITAVPDDILMNELRSSMITSAILVILALLVSCIIYLILAQKILDPFNRLVKVNEEFSSGDLTVRSGYKRNDELGKLASAFNHMADTIHNLVNNLESTVIERTTDLKESKDQLRLILDSTAEGIFGVDREGKCTICNVSCVELLGYTSQEEIIGQRMHDLIHHSTRDGKKILVTDCEIYKALAKGEKTHDVGEVFWRADGSFVEVEYYSYPQFVNNELIGAVVTFLDITERKKDEVQIEYLSSHDSLTGLINRHSFEMALKERDTIDNLPISIIFADVNALKLVNDIYGHSSGDLLIQKAARILKISCRLEDIVARVGGDEFIIMLPRTSTEDAINIMERVRGELEKEYVNSIQCSMALGVDTKLTSMQDIERTMGNAENQMYIEKTLNRHKLGVEAIDAFITTLHQKNELEKSHSEKVSHLCELMGIALGLSETEIYKLKEAGYLHDIGKIVLDDNLLNKGNVLTDDEDKEIQRHTAVGYRILNMFDSKLDLAEGIYAHHEKWDGTGYPKGLKGVEIPLSSRIIAIAETYERIRVKSSREDTFKELRKMSGIYFDPELTEIFIHKLKME